MGAHCAEYGQNEIALGVCLVGSFETMPPPDAQLQVLADRVVNPWMRMYGIAASDIYPHRYFEPAKTCPGTMTTYDLMVRFLPGIDPQKWRVVGAAV